MHSVATREETGPDLFELAGVPLSVLFADGDAIASVRAKGHGRLVLEPPYHVSDEDAYLVLPADIGLEIIDIFRDGDLDLVHEAMRDGLLVIGACDTSRRGEVVLECEAARAPIDLLRAGMPFAHAVTLSPGTDALAMLNGLDAVQCTVASELVDDDGLERILRSDEHVGISWRVPADAPPHVRGADPTFVWSRRLPDGRVAIETALFMEYEELVVVVRAVAVKG